MAGTVQWYNVANMLFKNVMDASIAIIFFYFVGYGIAFGKVGAENGIIGEGNFFLLGQENTGTNFLTDAPYDNTGYGMFFFQWAFSSTAATIVSGALAERTKVVSYFIYSAAMSAFIYPVVVHWIWDPSGWLSAHGKTTIFADSHNGVNGANGMIDCAGSCVVHVTGGFASLVAAKIVGPRIGRFKAAKISTHREFTGHSNLLCSLGVAILWLGWYGFNCGSILTLVGKSDIVAKIAVTTTISAASAAAVSALLIFVIKKDGKIIFDLNRCLNSVLAGLVAITGGCAVIDIWGAVIVGVIAVFVYEAASRLLIYFRIDDPLNAFPVHGACGLWGTLAVGIFATDENIKHVYGWENEAVSKGHQFLIQLLGAASTIAWVCILCAILFTLCGAFKILRINPVVEANGLDMHVMSGTAYAKGNMEVEMVKADSPSTPIEEKEEKERVR